MKFLPLALSTVMLTGAAIAAPTVMWAPSAHAVKPGIETRTMPKASSVPGSAIRESLLTIDSRELDVVGVTFPDRESSEAVTIEVRSRSGGRWGAWSEVEVMDAGPDSGTAEAARARIATEPVGTAGTDEVQVRARTKKERLALDALTATLVDGGRSAADAFVGRTPKATASAGAVRPTIISRQDWGADESLKACATSTVTTIKGAFVHHTVSKNTYTADEVPGMLRGIYAYHVKGNGWCDVGYNFFVDRFGRLFEGRSGGDFRNVVGAQAAGFNAQSVGVASLGNHDPATAGAVVPSSAALSAVGKLLGWKAWLNGWDPSTSVTYTSAGNTKWPEGAQVTLPRVSGHRDANLTACPGTHLHDRLATIRTGATTVYRAGVADATAEVAVAAAAAAETYTRPASGTFTLSGRGYGHGRGMSQYGAMGAASKGMTASQILGFYFPGTASTSTYGNPTLRVHLSELSTGGTQAVYQNGLVATDGTRTVNLGTASGAVRTRWRVVPDGAGVKLQYLNGTWVTLTGWGALAKPITLQNPGTSKVRVVLFGGAQREYRGSVRIHRSGTAAMSINLVPAQGYLQSVVPAEMPYHWHAEALKAQAVAARTFAAYQASRRASTSLFDTCDNSSCQVYRGAGEWTTGGVAVQREWPSTTSAVAATLGLIRTYGSAPALTEFGSSNGGQTAASTLPYQTSFPDPYDALPAGTTSAWTASIPVTKIESTYRTTGAFRSLTVNSRDGTSSWGGGRITSVTIRGASAAVTVTGEQFRSAMGLRSTWWTVTSSPAASAPSMPEDLSGDGRADLLAINPSGALTLMASGGTSSFSPVPLGPSWAGLNLAASAGAFDADARRDVVVREGGSLYLYPGNGKGGLLARQVVSSGWDTSTALFSMGDLDGDGRTDLVDRQASGVLRLHRGTGAGKIATVTSLGTGWNSLRVVTSPGDISGDGVPDVLAIRASDNALRLYTGVRGGSLRPAVTLSGAWAGYSHLMGAGDLTGDSRDDVVARRASDGALVVFAGDDMGGLTSAQVIVGAAPWASWSVWGD